MGRVTTCNKARQRYGIFPKLVLFDSKLQRSLQETDGSHFSCWIYERHYRQHHAPLIGGQQQSYARRLCTLSKIPISSTKPAKQTRYEGRKTMRTVCTEKKGAERLKKTAPSYDNSGRRYLNLIKQTGLFENKVVVTGSSSNHFPVLEQTVRVGHIV